MQIQERVIGTVTILDLQSRISLETGEDSLREIVNRFVQAGRRQLVLNLVGVPSLDSTSLGVIVSAFVTANRQGAALKLLHVTDRNRELLAIVRLADVFDIFDDEDAAVKSFSGG